MSLMAGGSGVQRLRRLASCGAALLLMVALAGQGQGPARAELGSEARMDAGPRAAAERAEEAARRHTSWTKSLAGANALSSQPRQLWRAGEGGDLATSILDDAMEKYEASKQRLAAKKQAAAMAPMAAAHSKPSAAPTASPSGVEAPRAAAEHAKAVTNILDNVRETEGNILDDAREKYEASKQRMAGEHTTGGHSQLLDAAANKIALALFSEGATGSAAQLAARVQRAVRVAALGLKDKAAARTQMLADPTSMTNERGRSGKVMSLEGDEEEESAMCKKKQVLIDKFDALLAKLGVNVKKANQTMERVSQAWIDARHVPPPHMTCMYPDPHMTCMYPPPHMTCMYPPPHMTWIDARIAWLDSEAAYRLAMQKAKEAKEGAAFGTAEYEKWAQANKAARKSLAETLAQHGTARTDLLNEKEVIKEIMRLIGVLHDVKATDKSIAAGGRDSVTDADSGASDPYNIKMTRTRAQLQAKIGQLKLLTQHTKVGVRDSEKLGQVPLFSRQSLAVYSETEAVAGILKQLLTDLDERVAVLDELDAKAQQLVSELNHRI
jgi:hypothetical protein